MSEQTPNQDPEIHHDFTHLTLVGDMPQPEEVAPAPLLPNPPQKSGGKPWLLALLFVFALAVSLIALNFYLENKALKADNLKFSQELASFQEHLQQTSGTLNQVKEKAANLDETLTKVKDTAAELERSRNDLDSNLATTRHELEARMSELAHAKQELDGLRKELAVSKAKLDATAKDRDGLSQRLDQLEKTRVEQLGSLQRQFDEARTAYDKQVTEMNKRLDGQRAEQVKARDLEASLRAQLKDVQEKFTAESQASQQILRDQSKLKGDLARFQQENKQLRTDLDKANGQIQDAKTIKTGQLLPQQDGLKNATPLAKGIWPGKSSKRGPFAVQILVDQDGRVEKAFLLEGQSIDGELAANLMTWIYNWKFSPPTYQNIRVKAWQTLLVSPE